MNFNRFFNFQTPKITVAAGILAVSSILSGILGGIRDYLLAKRFETGLLDIYFVAFRIPDLVFNILIAGGIVVAFLPLFSEYFSENKEKAWQFTSNCLNIFLFLLIAITIILFLFTPFLVKMIVPGFPEEKLKETVFLTRLLFLSPIFLGLSTIFSGVLQYFNRFLIYSLCPIFYNLGIILGILVFSPHFGILGVVLGVILGAFLHFAIQIPSTLNCGFQYKPLLKLKDPSIKKFFLLMLPRTFGISAQQINLLIITAIASTLSLGAISVFTFANNFQNFIVGIVGTSFAIAAFPQFSRALAEFKKTPKILEEFTKSFSTVFRQVLYLIIPLSFLIFFFRNQIINLWLRHGQFSSESAQLTAASLALFSFGLFALALIPLIFRAFFAFQDTKTPTLITLVSIVLNIILSVFLTWILKSQVLIGLNFQNLIKNIFSLSNIENIQVLGLPLAIVISTIFQFVLLIIFLKKRIVFQIDNLREKE
jgi:putative peptidoglycan lipid II flippase